MPIQYIPHPISADKTDVTASRAIGGVYTNNTLRPRRVQITMTHRVTAAGSFCLVQLNCPGAMAWGGWFNTPAVGIELYSEITGDVAPGESYQLNQNAAGGVNTILRWWEVAQ